MVGPWDQKRSLVRGTSNDQLWQVHESLQIEVNTWEGCYIYMTDT